MPRSVLAEMRAHFADNGWHASDLDALRMEDTGAGNGGESGTNGESGGANTAGATGAGGEPDWKAEAEKWQALSKKNEERAKANHQAAKELDQLRQSSMSEIEKAAAKARAEGEAEAMKRSAARLVDAEVKAACAGRKVDVAALLEGVDRSRFVTDDGDVDTKSITAWVDRIVPKTTADLGQGSRGASGGGDMNSMIRERMRPR